MMDNSEKTSPENVARPAKAESTLRARIRFYAYLLVTLAVFTYLLWPDAPDRSGNEIESEAPRQIELLGDGNIEIKQDSPIFNKLEIITVKPQTVTSPKLLVTGTVVASRNPSRSDKGWQFSSPDLLSLYTEWQKAAADISFARSQFDSIGKLSNNRVEAQELIVKRLERLVAAGTNPENELLAAKTELLQLKLEGHKDVYEAETAMRLAERSRSAIRGQLEQAGLDPDLLGRDEDFTDIVVADVPEAYLSRVKEGQGCEAGFTALDGTSFKGVVRVISPVLSDERRSIRVLFTIQDPDDSVRPGLYADIGLGTDSREAVLVPATGIVHVDRHDYLLVRSPGKPWQVTRVDVGELHGEKLEILTDIAAGSEIVGGGAILLKPVMIESLRRSGRERENRP